MPTNLKVVNINPEYLDENKNAASIEELKNAPAKTMKNIIVNINEDQVVYDRKNKRVSWDKNQLRDEFFRRFKRDGHVSLTEFCQEHNHPEESAKLVLEEMA